MKKTILALGLAAILGSAALFYSGLTGTVLAQGSGGTTKVAIVNVGLVFTKYEKASFTNRNWNPL